MTSRAELIIGLVISILLTVAITLFAGHYRELQKDAAVGKLRGGVLESTSAGVEQGVKIDQEQARQEQGIAAARDQFQNSKQKAKDNEPETASRSVRPVPDSVRAAYRERRLARERLGCTGSECP